MSKRGKRYYEDYNNDYNNDSYTEPSWIGRNLFLGIVVALIIGICYGAKWVSGKVSDNGMAKVDTVRVIKHDKSKL